MRVLRVNLSNSRKASIVSCTICTDRKEDHVFNPNDKCWYCEKCYNVLQDSYADDGEPDYFPWLLF